MLLELAQKYEPQGRKEPVPVAAHRQQIVNMIYRHPLIIFWLWGPKEAKVGDSNDHSGRRGGLFVVWVSDSVSFRQATGASFTV